MAAPKRLSPAQIINRLRKAEVALANGKPTKELVLLHLAVSRQARPSAPPNIGSFPNNPSSAPPRTVPWTILRSSTSFRLVRLTPNYRMAQSGMVKSRGPVPCNDDDACRRRSRSVRDRCRLHRVAISI